MTTTIPQIHWPHLLPLLVVVVGAVAVLMWDTFFRSRDRAFLVGLTLMVLASAIGITLGSVADLAGGSVSFGGMYVFDRFTAFVFVLIMLASFLSVLVGCRSAEP